MKKILLIVFALISVNLFSQIEVKEGSFHKIEGYVMLDKSEHIDDNNNPMALIMITTENMTSYVHCEKLKLLDLSASRYKKIDSVPISQLLGILDAVKGRFEEV